MRSNSTRGVQWQFDAGGGAFWAGAGAGPDPFFVKGPGRVSLKLCVKFCVKIHKENRHSASPIKTDPLPVPLKTDP